MSTALSKAAKQIEKDEKKRIKDAEATLRRLIARKPDKMTEADLSQIKSAMEDLRGCSLRLIHVANNMGDGR